MTTSSHFYQEDTLSLHLTDSSWFEEERTENRCHGKRASHRINCYCVEIVWRNIKNVFTFSTLFSAPRRHGWLKIFLVEAKNQFILNSQNHRCSCPGDTGSWGVSSHCIDRALSEYICFSRRRINILQPQHAISFGANALPKCFFFQNIGVETNGAFMLTVCNLYIAAVVIEISIHLYIQVQILNTWCIWDIKNKYAVFAHVLSFTLWIFCQYVI